MRRIRRDRLSEFRKSSYQGWRGNSSHLDSLHILEIAGGCPRKASYRSGVVHTNGAWHSRSGGAALELISPPAEQLTPTCSIFMMSVLWFGSERLGSLTCQRPIDKLCALFPLASGTVAPRMRTGASFRRVRSNCPSKSRRMGPKVRERSLDRDRPAVTVTEITDPTTANHGIELIDQDAVQLTSKPFRARRVVVCLEGGVVVYQSTNHRIRTRTKTQQGLLAYVTFSPRAKGTVNGLPIRPELLLAVEPETEVVFVTNAGHESISILLPPGDVRAHLIARRREQEFRMPRGVEALRVETTMVRRLFDWAIRLVRKAALQSSLFNGRKEARAAAQVEMVETLLSTLGAARDFEPTHADQVHQTQTFIVKAAEDYALSHTNDHVYVGDLCRAAATSERALEYAFKNVIGLTPVAYLTRLRLHRVRRALLAATHGSATVSALALDWGFWHFGDFARAYKDCFGELPSETLRRTPGEAKR